MPKTVKEAIDDKLEEEDSDVQKQRLAAVIPLAEQLALQGTKLKAMKRREAPIPEQKISPQFSLTPTEETAESTPPESPNEPRDLKQSSNQMLANLAAQIAEACKKQLNGSNEDSEDSSEDETWSDDE